MRFEGFKSFEIPLGLMVIYRMGFTEWDVDFTSDRGDYDEDMDSNP